MIFENKRFVGKVKLFRFLLLVSLCVIIVSVMLTNAIDAYSFGLGRFIYIALACVVYIVISVYRYRRNYNYFYYSDENNLLEVRYYQTIMFGSKYKMVKMPLNQLFKYEIESPFLQKNLVLYQKDQQGKVSKYAGVSITALEPNELQVILNNLGTYLNNAKTKNL